MEEIKKRFDEYFKGNIDENSYLHINTVYIRNFIQSEIDLAVSKERERRDAQIIEFINSGEPAPWNDTGWSVELSDVEKFIKNTK